MKRPARGLAGFGAEDTCSISSRSQQLFKFLHYLSGRWQQQQVAAKDLMILLLLILFHIFLYY